MNEHVVKKIKQWVFKANNDLKTARDEMNTSQPATDTVCFHAQQCVEKLLKAFLTSSNLHAGRTHNLVKLVEMCKTVDKEFDYLYTLNVAGLNEYAIDVRYPDDFYIPEIDEAKSAIETAEKVTAFVLRKLEEKGIKL